MLGHHLVALLLVVHLLLGYPELRPPAPRFDRRARAGEEPAGGGDGRSAVRYGGAVTSLRAVVRQLVRDRLQQMRWATVATGRS